MSDLQLARTAAALILDLHEKCLRAAEGGPDKAEEWVKLRADYVSACSTTAAVVAAAFQDMDKAASAMLAALEDLWPFAKGYLDYVQSLKPAEREKARARVAAATVAPKHHAFTSADAVRAAGAAIAAAKAAGIAA